MSNSQALVAAGFAALLCVVVVVAIGAAIAVTLH
jgi:hypothetical protein